MPRRLVAIWNALTAAALVSLAAKVLLVAGVRPVALALAIPLATFAALAGLASLHLWRGARVGALLTLLVQVPHLAQFELPPLSWLTSLPVALSIGLDSDLHLHWVTRWRPALQITPDPDPVLYWAGVNLPVLAAVVVAGLAFRAAAPRVTSPA